MNPGEVAISVEPEVEKGAYQFYLCDRNRGQVASRVIASPQHAQALLAALDENIKK